MIHKRSAVRVRYAAGLTAGLVLLALAVAGGLAVGAQSVPPAEVFAALLEPDAPHASIVRGSGCRAPSSPSPPGPRWASPGR
ncbi:hypothetical protein ABMX48_35440 [Streptomyces cavourensis]